jgi:hypothetical protein
MLSLSAQQNYGVAYFYFSFDRALEQSLHHVLSSLAKQLTAQAKPLVNDVERLYNESQCGTTIPTSDQLEITISSIVKAKTFSHIFLVFDAFDECRAELRSSFLSLFKQMADDKINVFVTSRPNIQEIQAYPTMLGRYHSQQRNTTSELTFRNESIKTHAWGKRVLTTTAMVGRM